MRASPQRIVDRLLGNKPWKAVLLEILLIALYLYPVGTANSILIIALAVAFAYRLGARFFGKLGLVSLSISLATAAISDTSRIAEAAAVDSLYFFIVAGFLAQAEHWQIAARVLARLMAASIAISSRVVRGVRRLQAAAAKARVLISAAAVPWADRGSRRAPRHRRTLRSRVAKSNLMFNLLPATRKRSPRIQKVLAGCAFVILGLFQLYLGFREIGRPVPGTGNPEIAKMAQRQEEALVRQSSRFVSIIDGSGTSGTAPAVATLLASRGFRIASIAKAGQPANEGLIRYQRGWRDMAERVRRIFPKGQSYALVEDGSTSDRSQVEIVVPPPEIPAVPILILNGSGKAGAAAATAAKLRSSGYRVMGIANARDMAHKHTTIRYSASYQSAAEALARELERRDPLLAPTSDASKLLIVVLGRDEAAR